MKCCENLKIKFSFGTEILIIHIFTLFARLIFALLLSWFCPCSFVRTIPIYLDQITNIVKYNIPNITSFLRNVYFILPRLIIIITTCNIIIKIILFWCIKLQYTSINVLFKVVLFDPFLKSLI